MMQELGKRAVACKAWKWMPGMLAVGRIETPRANDREAGNGLFRVMEGSCEH